LKLKKILNESFSKFIKDKNELELMINYIQDNYTKPGRFYHNQKHIEDLFNKASSMKSVFEHYDDVILAIIFHDLVYDEKGNNESRSVELCSDFLSKYKFIPFRINKINKMILATSKHHLTNDKDTNLLIDLDLSVLGSDSQTFDNYCKNIYSEYYYFYSQEPNFNENLFNLNYLENRIKILKSFNKRSNIYLTKQFRHLEEKAKQNLTNEILKLEDELNLIKNE
jgi:predicted metal-dependent HD superfamily phosphohydrolase